MQLIDTGNRWFFQAHTKPGTRAPKPLELHRPWEEDKAPAKRRMATSEEMVKFFGGAAKYTGPKGDRPRTPFEVSVLEDEHLSDEQKKTLISRFRARAQ